MSDDLAKFVDRETTHFFDKSKNILIPIAIYTSKNKSKKSKQKINIFNYGYGANNGGDYLAYSYLTNELVIVKGIYKV